MIMMVIQDIMNLSILPYYLDYYRKYQTYLSDWRLDPQMILHISQHTDEIYHRVIKVQYARSL